MRTGQIGWNRKGLYVVRGQHGNTLEVDYIETEEKAFLKADLASAAQDSVGDPLAALMGALKEGHYNLQLHAPPRYVDRVLERYAEETDGLELEEKDLDVQDHYWGTSARVSFPERFAALLPAGVRHSPKHPHWVQVTQNDVVWDLVRRGLRLSRHKPSSGGESQGSTREGSPAAPSAVQ